MRVLGISARPRQGAAAIAVDGRVIAAVTDESVAPVAGRGGAATSHLPFAAIQACLAHARLASEHIDLVAVEGLDERDLDDTRARWSGRAADPSLRGLAAQTHVAVPTLTARAAQALLASRDGHARIAVLDLDGATGGGTYQADGGALVALQSVDGIHQLSGAIADVAQALGIDPHLSALVALAERGHADYLPALRQALVYKNFSVDASGPALAAAVAQAADAAPG